MSLYFLLKFELNFYFDSVDSAIGFIHINNISNENKKGYHTFISILIKIALLCQKKDSYTDSVYSKDTFGTIWVIPQRVYGK